MDPRDNVFHCIEDNSLNLTKINFLTIYYYKKKARESNLLYNPSKVGDRRTI